MQIAVIGTGYVGLVSGACLAHVGWNVTCIDNNPAKIDTLKQGHIPIYEPGLEDIVKACHQTGTLSFTTSHADGITNADLVILAVGTPTDATTGQTDLSYLKQALDDAIPHLKQQVVIVTKSTVPIGTGDKLQDRVKQQRQDLVFSIASNPEFLREGAAVYDFLTPDRIVIGSDNQHALTLLETLYKPFIDQGFPLLKTQLRSAEMIKYTANSFLAMKIAYINQIADLCDAAHADISEVATGIGLDQRIGAQHLKPGPGYGGSCFPKDTEAFATFAKDAGCPLSLVETTIAANRAHQHYLVDKIMHACGGNVCGKKIAVWGLTFKANTDDMRDSPSLVIIPELCKRGATIHAFDPIGMNNAKSLLPKEIEYASTEIDAARDAEALVIITEWKAFYEVDLDALRSIMRQSLIIDLRNGFNRSHVESAQFRYVTVGHCL